MGDVVDDIGDDVRWMSYAELGQARGISTASATRLAFRRKWRRQNGNNGSVRVAVPVDEAKPQKAAPPDNVDDIRDDDRGDIIRVISVLEAAVATLREQFARENVRADRLEQERNAEHDRAEAAGVQIEQLRRVLREAEAGLTAERAAKATVGAEATQLRQSLEQALADAQEAIRSATAEAVQLRQAKAKAEQSIQGAEAEAARLRQVAEQAVQEAEGLRQAEIARTAAQAVETDRPAMVASRIDEVQFRRLQEAEQARKSLGLLSRLRLAWRGE